MLLRTHVAHRGLRNFSDEQTATRFVLYFGWIYGIIIIYFSDNPLLSKQYMLSKHVLLNFNYLYRPWPLTKICVSLKAQIKIYTSV